MNAVFPGNNGYGPKEGPMWLTYHPDFSARATVPLTLHEELAADAISFVQTVYIDNSENSAPLILAVVGGTEQIIFCPPASQGIFPIIGTTSEFNVTCAQGADVTMLFGNVPMAYSVWAAGTPGVTPAPTPVMPVAPTTLVSVADVALANGAPTTLLVANPNRISAVIVAPTTNTVAVRVGGGATSAASGIEVWPGQSVTLTTQATIFAYAGVAAQTMQIIYTGN